MKKKLFLALSIAFLASCSGDDTIKTTPLDQEELLGVWVFDGVEDKIVETNDWFACEYTPEGQNFSGRVYLDDGSCDWYYKSLSTYHVEDDFLYVSSDYDDIKLQVKIVDGDPDLISWKEIYNIEYGDDLNQGRTFSGYRSTVDYSEDIVNGYWEGGNVIDGREPSVYLRFKYNSDSTFTFQTRESEDDPWSEKIDNDGKYYILGDLLASSWKNDINSGVESINEAWSVAIEGDTMVWTAIREGDKKERYELKRVLE